MKNLKNLMTAVTLFAVLVLGTASANAGILLGDRGVSTEDPCAENDTKFDMGIIVAGFTGIIVAGRGGIIVAGRDGIIVAGKGGDTQVNCGILMGD